MDSPVPFRTGFFCFDRRPAAPFAAWPAGNERNTTMTPHASYRSLTVPINSPFFCQPGRLPLTPSRLTGDRSAFLSDRPADRPLGRLLARAAAEFEQRLFGRPPRSVTVTSQGNTLSLCLQQPFGEMERELAADPASGRRIRVFHEDLFACLRGPFRDHVATATGIDLPVALLDIDLEHGCLLKTFSTGPEIDLYLFGPAADPLAAPIDGHAHADANPPAATRLRRQAAVELLATARSHEGSQTMKR